MSPPEDAPPARDPGASNIPEYSVGDLSAAVKRTLEGAFGRVRVRGEIVECKAYGPTRFYFSLKDPDPDSKAKLAAVVWSWSAARTGVRPENGTEVIATGRLTAYGDRSSYQLVVDRLDYAGEGALLARIEALRQRLLAEGLFAAERKRALPRLPRVIGVVTSERGAVIQDIRTTIARRFPRRILLWPVAVQGAGAAEQIAAAIRGFGALPADGPIPRPDVVIVARGGGSLEDLMAFNEEVVVRAAADCPIPLISAVGHETDTTLIDFAADRRAPTPTAAAELAVPARAELLDALRQVALRMGQAQRGRLGAGRLALTRAAARLPDLPGLVGRMRQRLDEWVERLGRAPAEALRRRHAPLAQLAVRLRHPREVIAAHRATLRLAETRAGAGFRARIERARTALARRGALSAAPVQALLRHDRTRLRALAARLEAVSYQAVLARGFALVTRAADGSVVAAAAAVAPGDRLRLTFADGAVATTASLAGTAAAQGGAAPDGTQAPPAAAEAPDAPATAPPPPATLPTAPADPTDAPEPATAPGRRGRRRRPADPPPPQGALL
jgi:exodeoxyribonuclease VII large subunit